MRKRGWLSRSGLMVAGVCTAVVLTACGGEFPTESEEGSSSESTSAANSPSTTTKEPSSSTTTPNNEGTGEIPQAAAQDLCSMVEPELSNFRVQGPSLGRVGLNAMVHEWALRNGALNAKVLADKSLVDQAMTDACPDVHQQVVDALELQDLASGLAF